jgi:hypothetical protein
MQFAAADGRNRRLDDHFAWPWLRLGHFNDLNLSAACKSRDTHEDLLVGLCKG